MWKELLKRLTVKPRYEYKIFTLRKGGPEEHIANQLTALGDDRWEVTSVLENTRVNFKALLKREV